nr:immunoglobulin heavy chain junction region [Mus musculus]
CARRNWSYWYFDVW